MNAAADSILVDSRFRAVQTVFFVSGAHKSGTSWAHEYLFTRLQTAVTRLNAPDYWKVIAGQFQLKLRTVLFHDVGNAKNPVVRVLENFGIIGDDPAMARQLRRVVPAGRRLVQFASELFMGQTVGRLCECFGIVGPNVRGRRVHSGDYAVMLDIRRPKALKKLNEYFEWVACKSGPLPQRWQDNQARMHA